MVHTLLTAVYMLHTKHPQWLQFLTRPCHTRTDLWSNRGCRHVKHDSSKHFKTVLLLSRSLLIILSRGFHFSLTSQKPCSGTNYSIPYFPCGDFTNFYWHNYGQHVTHFTSHLTFCATVSLHGGPWYPFSASHFVDFMTVAYMAYGNHQ